MLCSDSIKRRGGIRKTSSADRWAPRRPSGSSTPVGRGKNHSQSRSTLSNSPLLSSPLLSTHCFSNGSLASCLLCPRAPICSDLPLAARQQVRNESLFGPGLALGDWGDLGGDSGSAQVLRLHCRDAQEKEARCQAPLPLFSHHILRKAPPLGLQGGARDREGWRDISQDSRWKHPQLWVRWGLHPDASVQERHRLRIWS